MSKFFVKSENVEGNIIRIEGTDVNHIKNVLRMKKQNKLIICNTENNMNYNCIIESIEKKEIVCKIIENLGSNSETNCNIHLFQGLPKADKMEYIIQKTTELGVKRIIPVKMERCVAKINDKDKINKIDRWRKIAEVAAKQSQRDTIPVIDEIIKLNDINIDKYDVFIIAYEKEKNISIKNLLQKNKQSKNIGILIGPEGGINEKEIKLLQEKGGKLVSLGERILRTETAPIALISMIIYELEM